jgi:hypothetical protein
MRMITAWPIATYRPSAAGRLPSLLHHESEHPTPPQPPVPYRNTTTLLHLPFLTPWVWDTDVWEATFGRAAS